MYKIIKGNSHEVEAKLNSKAYYNNIEVISMSSDADATTILIRII